MVVSVVVATDVTVVVERLVVVAVLTWVKVNGSPGFTWVVVVVLRIVAGVDARSRAAITKAIVLPIATPVTTLCLRGVNFARPPEAA